MNAIGDPPRLDYISKYRIRVDDSYQRPVRAQRVRQIVRNFDWKQFGTLMLVDRGEGDFTVYDGQHRLAGAMEIDDIDLLPCAIVVLDAAYEEAQSFLGVNVNRSAITTVEKYWAGIEAGDETMMRICAVLEEAGCEVVPPGRQSPAPNRTKSVSALERALNAHGDEAVLEACRTLRAAWPNDSNALGGVLIRALARLYCVNRGGVSTDQMVTRLRGKDRRILAADAEAMKKISGGDAVVSLSKTLVEIYNRGLSKNLISASNRKAGA